MSEPLQTNDSTSGASQKWRNAVFCACGCGEMVGFYANGKPKKYATRNHKDRLRNHLRYQRQKKAIALAREILMLFPKEVS